jgi:hypothetical protein
MAIRDREIAAESVGIDVARYKVLAFVWSSAITAVAGALFAYQRAFVSVEGVRLLLGDRVHRDDHHRRARLGAGAPCSARPS